jgi:HEPN domain-containing protein
MAGQDDLAAELLELAGDDEAALRALLPVESVSDSIVGFHAQQAVEKSLKAVLASRGIDFPFSHDLARLMTLCQSAGMPVPVALADADRLTPYAVRFRYGAAVAADVPRAEASVRRPGRHALPRRSDRGPPEGAGRRDPRLRRRQAPGRRDHPPRLGVLFDQLKSARAVAQYLERVADDPVALGGEPTRYYQLAGLDAAAAPSPPPAPLLPGGKLFSGPLLPMQPVADADRRPHQVFRALLEDIATATVHPDRRRDLRRVLAALDAMPVAERGTLGEFILNACAEVSGAEAGMIEWRRRCLLLPDGRTQLAFGASNAPYDEGTADMLEAWVELRHHDAFSDAANDEAITVAVLVTPRVGAPDRWDTSMQALAGHAELPAARLEVLREVWDGAFAVGRDRPGAPSRPAHGRAA